MKITAPDLKELGVIDEIIEEVKGGAHKNAKLQSERIDEVLEVSLNTLLSMSSEELIEQRYEKYKKIGQFGYVSDSIVVK